MINYVIFRLSFGSPGPPLRTPPPHHKGTPRGRNINKQVARGGYTTRSHHNENFLDHVTLWVDVAVKFKPVAWALQ